MIEKLDLNKPVLLRLDLNMPLDDDGNILDSTRLMAHYKTIEYILSKGGKPIIISHVGRPKLGLKLTPKLSLVKVGAAIKSLFNSKLKFISSWMQADIDLNSADIFLLENCRFYDCQDDAIAQRLAKLSDTFINDGFSVAHRSEATTTGLVKHVKHSALGLHFRSELDLISQTISSKKHLKTAVIGGSKISDKLELLNNLLVNFDSILIGGAMANTILAALGNNLGNSLKEDSMYTKAIAFLDNARKLNKRVCLPIDMVVKTDKTNAAIKLATSLCASDVACDIGPETSLIYSKIIKESEVVIWNGPMGIFEENDYSNGSKNIAIAITESKAYSIAGGGDSVYMINKMNISGINHICTGGGAFLHLLSFNTLPALEAILRKFDGKKT